MVLGNPSQFVRLKYLEIYLVLYIYHCTIPYKISIFKSDLQPSKAKFSSRAGKLYLMQRNPLFSCIICEMVLIIGPKDSLTTHYVQIFGNQFSSMHIPRQLHVTLYSIMIDTQVKRNLTPWSKKLYYEYYIM